jgi:hypothetical protein
MRLRLLATILLAALALAGCGDDENASTTPTVPFEPPTDAGVSSTIRGYLTALNRGDGKEACRRLDDRGKSALVAFLPSSKAALRCEQAVPQVRDQIIPLRRFTIEQVTVSGRSATATVEARDPPYSSGVLLSNVGDGWKISYPPGLRGKSGEAPPPAVPGVPLEQD